MRTRRRVEI
jgi:hypothetical protein